MVMTIPNRIKTNSSISTQIVNINLRVIFIIPRINKWYTLLFIYSNIFCNMVFRISHREDEDTDHQLTIVFHFNVVLVCAHELAELLIVRSFITQP